jgi:hypothetical protein
VLPWRTLPDENLQRRIAVLRGDKTAAAAIARINAKLKAGDDEGAEAERRIWTASMGSVMGFFSVIRSVPIADPASLGGRPLWPDRPLHLGLLDADTPDVLRAAAIMDTAALKGKLVESASAWPLCGLTAAMHNYGPALRAISVLMQRNPQADLPAPPREELLTALQKYRRHLGDLPADPAGTQDVPPATEVAAPAAASGVSNASPSPAAP